MKGEPGMPQAEGHDSEIEKALRHLMTAEEYSRSRHEHPYVFSLEARGKCLHYFGARHTCDPSDPMLQDLESAFLKANPNLVMVEGVKFGGDRNVFDSQVRAASPEHAVLRMGEPGFAIKLAVDRNIEWVSPEPDDSAHYEYLLDRGFTRDQIFARDVIHLLPQYHEQLKREGFREYVSYFLDRFKRETKWKDFDYSYDRAVALSEEIIGRPIDVETEKHASGFIDPIPWEETKAEQTVFNRISAESSRFRDREVVRQIALAMKTHDRIFVVFGSSHAVMQEPALRELFTKTT